MNNQAEGNQHSSILKFSIEEPEKMTRKKLNICRFRTSQKRSRYFTFRRKCRQWIKKKFIIWRKISINFSFKYSFKSTNWLSFYDFRNNRMHWCRNFYANNGIFIFWSFFWYRKYFWKYIGGRYSKNERNCIKNNE